MQEDGVGVGFGGQAGLSSDPESAPSLAREPGVSSFILLSFPFLLGGKWQSLRKGRGEAWSVFFFVFELTVLGMS